MPRIAIISLNPLSNNGVTSVILNLLSSLDRNNLDLFIFTDKKVDDKVKMRLLELNVKLIQIENKRSFMPNKYIRELKKELIDNNIEILHVHGNSATMWLEIFIGKLAGIPIRIAHSHTSKALSNSIHFILRPLLIKDMTLGIGCSDLSQKFAFRNKKSIILNNGIIIEDYKFDTDKRKFWREKLGIDQEFVIGHVGNFVPVKNQIFICKVVNELKTIGLTNFKLILIGDGDTQDDIKQYIENHNLQSNIILLNSNVKVNELYQAMDLFILPSLFEGFPMVLIEAQTSGLNCLISDRVSKTTNILGTSKFLDIESPNSPTNWAKEIINQKNKFKTASRINSYKIVEESGYSVSKISKKLDEIYHRVHF